MLTINIKRKEESDELCIVLLDYTNEIVDVVLKHHCFPSELPTYINNLLTITDNLTRKPE